MLGDINARETGTKKARANARQVQAQRNDFAMRWGLDIDEVDTTPSTDDYGFGL